MANSCSNIYLGSSSFYTLVVVINIPTPSRTPPWKPSYQWQPQRCSSAYRLDAAKCLVSSAIPSHWGAVRDAENPALGNAC